MSKKRFAYIGTVFVLLLALILPGCKREIVQMQGLSHLSGPLDLAGTATESAPGLYFDGDSDTGLYSAAANQLGVSVAGSNVGTFSSTGLAAVGMTVGGLFAVDDGAVLVATYGGALTPLTSSVVITAASTITNATLSACSVDGQLAFIAIAGSNDVTITEGSTLYAGGDIALDASEFDGVILMCYNTKWRKMGAFGDN